MQDSTWVGITSMRAQAANALILPFVLMHSVVLVIIAFAGDALGDSSVQLAVAAVVVIGSIWTTLNIDGVFADFAALRKDMPDGVASSNFGAVLQKLPIGAMEKSKVRALAKEAGLKTAQKPDSQEICFVPSNDYRKLLEEHAVALHPGPLVDTAGRVLGTHPGTEHFTIGQRRGLGVAGGVPLYVIDIVPATGTVVLGGVEECQSRWLELETVNLIGFDPPADRTFRAQVQVRYHHTAAAATIAIGESDERTRVEFDEPQNAVAAGQGAAFYRGERLLGGGWIARAERPRGSGTPEVGAQRAPSSPVSSG